ncbi:DNA polymerase I [Paenibacillus antri]|uniref:DNA polymerase I n=1 Tax=Paenibacillus antri TaxID=2582848 RepID=A0A5R9GAH3_9BACL|nr:DNA polymerase I [Paenibacillus antri]TLS48425.1 DNA polymerase I [Paenibacillus antri]
MAKCLLIDGNSIINRAFYALPPLTNGAGLHTNAVYGFTTMLLRIIEEEKPTHLLVAFDAGKRTFRHEEYGDYKGGRSKTPSELSEQFPLLKELLQAMNVKQFEIEGYEADDIIGTLTKRADEEGIETIVVSGDKDMLQLASDRVRIALTRKGISETEMYDPAYIQEKYQLTPRQIIDLKGLMGDASDNIPGVPGVGEKTALKLLHQFGSVEGVLEHVEEIKGKMKETIKEHADSARMSKEIATIFREVPYDAGWDELAFEGFDTNGMRTMFQKLEFKSLLERLAIGGSDAASGGSEAAAIQVTTVDASTVASLVAALPDVRGAHVESIGENPHGAEVLGLALYADEERTYFAPMPFLASSEAAPLRSWLADANARKTIHDAHKAELALAWQGVELRGVAFDTILAAYLLDPTESSHALSDIAGKDGIAVPSDDDVFGKGAKFKLPEPEKIAEHLGRKARAVAELAERQRKKLAEHEMEPLMYELELPLSFVLARMELQGVKVDVDELKRYGVELTEALDKLVATIYEQAGTEFNLNSTKQLGEILFEKLGLPPVKKTKTGYSTDAEVLEKLAPYHEIVSNLLHYRTLSKLQSTYVEGLQKEVRATGKIHTYYRQTIAATGRLSSQFPNLQNIPIRTEEGRKLRKMFVPSEPGWRILAADYSQIELRVLAHISGDERMKEAFQNDMDIHTKTAMDVFGVSADAVDANMRRQAKAVNFGIVYGISDFGLSNNLGINRKDAAQFIEQYLDVFSGVRRFMDDIKKQARKDGYVTTLLNRRRYLPEIHASNFNIRSFAERTAMNTPIQGTAADIIKLAMVRLDDRMREAGVKSRMLLQVHDELVFEVPPEELETMRAMVRETMESALALDVPLKVEVSEGSNWYEAK